MRKTEPGDPYFRAIQAMDHPATIEAIAEGLNDLEHGRTIPLQSAMDRLERKYESETGLEADRAD